MTEKTDFDMEIDLKGLVCPLPMIKVSQNIPRVPVGGVLKAITTDPGSLSDIASWARSTGNKVLKIDKAPKEFVFYIKRTK